MYQVQCPRASLIEDSTHATAVEVVRNEKEPSLDLVAKSG